MTFTAKPLSCEPTKLMGLSRGIFSPRMGNAQRGKGERRPRRLLVERSVK
jgi:hypothetical protein